MCTSVHACTVNHWADGTSVTEVLHTFTYMQHPSRPALPPFSSSPPPSQLSRPHLARAFLFIKVITGPFTPVFFCSKGYTCSTICGQQTTNNKHTHNQGSRKQTDKPTTEQTNKTAERGRWVGCAAGQALGGSKEQSRQHNLAASRLVESTHTRKTIDRSMD